MMCQCQVQTSRVEKVRVGKHTETSLKIFKHYKLKPSFSIIKDEKAKDKVGVGANLIKFDPS